MEGDIYASDYAKSDYADASSTRTHTSPVDTSSPVDTQPIRPSGPVQVGAALSVAAVDDHLIPRTLRMEIGDGVYVCVCVCVCVMCDACVCACAWKRVCIVGSLYYVMYDCDALCVCVCVSVHKLFMSVKPPVYIQIV